MQIITSNFCKSSTTAEYLVHESEATIPPKTIINIPYKTNSKEICRNECLRSLNILDTEYEESFNSIIKLVKIYLDVPMVLISLVDGSRQWFKAKIGDDYTFVDNTGKIVKGYTKYKTISTFENSFSNICLIASFPTTGSKAT